MNVSENSRQLGTIDGDIVKLIIVRWIWNTTVYTHNWKCGNLGFFQPQQQHWTSKSYWRTWAFLSKHDHVLRFKWHLNFKVSFPTGSHVNNLESHNLFAGDRIMSNKALNLITRFIHWSTVFLRFKANIHHTRLTATCGECEVSFWQKKRIMVLYEREKLMIKNYVPKTNYSKQNEPTRFTDSVQVNFSFKLHYSLSDPRHGCLFSTDLRHAYFGIPMHPEDRVLFAFTIPGLGQLQPTRFLDPFVHWRDDQGVVSCLILDSESVAMFKDLFYDRFSIKNEDEFDFDLDFELFKLRQQLDQFVIFNYKKPWHFWRKLAVKIGQSMHFCSWLRAPSPTWWRKPSSAGWTMTRSKMISSKNLFQSTVFWRGFISLQRTSIAFEIFVRDLMEQVKLE